MFGESFAEAWRRRFGTEPTAAGHGLDRLLAHRSVRDFIPRPLAPELRSVLFAAAQSAATSSHLSGWSAIAVDDPELRESMAIACGDQRQIRSAGMFLAFLIDHARLRECAARHGVEPTGLDTLEMVVVSAVDAAIAAERLVVAAEALGLGTCYIGALRNQPERVAELLHLPRGTFGLFGLCVGEPTAEARAEIKPRLGSAVQFMSDRYAASPDLPEFEDRMATFYASQGQDASVRWSARTARRVTVAGLSGRERLGAAMRAQGLLAAEF
ncbi:MAG: nitroreductase family protein [Fimbriimonadaceae bacterium]|nr:nitroreductase family protein [Fimbriimonadaceae bacterium]